jgi:hypothetical protein
VNLKNLKGESLRRELRSIFAHEVMHWAHISSKGLQADVYRHMVTAHFNSRTEGKELVNGEYMDGGWYDLYAGRCYPLLEKETGFSGFELPTMYYELWEKPDILSSITDLNEGNSAVANRETFFIINKLFDNP